MKQDIFPDSIEVKPFSGYEKCRFAILPVPYEGTVSYGKGASKGPAAILEASKNLETYDEEIDKNAYKAGIAVLNPLKSASSPEQMVNDVEKASEKIINDNKFPVMLGGEHSITTGLVRALRKKYNDLSVLQLDAHADLRQEYHGTPYSHASIMARVREICPAVQVGIRSLSAEEAEWIKKNSLLVFWARDIYNNEDWFEKAIEKLSKNVFITIDLDVFDPSVMSATGTPEPGGLDWYTVIKFLKKVCQKRNVVGFDVVELAPTKEVSCDFLAAKLVYRMIGYLS
jgi:agmatinase